MSSRNICLLIALGIFLIFTFGCEEAHMIRSVMITPEGEPTRHLGQTTFKVSVKVDHDERDADGNPVRINVLQPSPTPGFTVEAPVTVPKPIVTTITEGTIENGAYVDAQIINSAAKIEVTFSEQVSGHIVLQTFGGDDVGWIGKVTGNKDTLELANGKELDNGTLYMIICAITNHAGIETRIKTVFHTTGTKGPVAKPVIPEEPEVSFKNDILPIFKAHCQTCHRQKARKDPVAGLGLSNYKSTMKGSKNGKIIDPGWSKQSPIYLLIHPGRSDIKRMPLGKPLLSNEEFQLILDWIDEGAKDN